MKNTNQKHQNKHIPVLLREVLTYLNPRPGEAYLDLTAGYGGHAAKVLEVTKEPGKAVLVDRDKNAVAELRRQFEAEGVQIVQKDFLHASRELLHEGRKFDLILADLGVSSPHLDNASRGFSFRADGPLDMRMDERQPLTAKEIVNSYPEAELAAIIRRYGEEPHAKKIARILCEHRPIDTTQQLADIIAKASPGYSKTHPATRTFQALRIEVNDELEQIRQVIPMLVDLLSPGGRVAIISFHSLEDRIVKQAFSEAGGDRYDAPLSLPRRQPVMADANEIVFNPRARSAKLRVAVKK